LETAVNNSDPTALTVGNSSLAQSYSHTGEVRFNYANVLACTSFMLALNGTTTSRYIGTATYQYLTRDTVVHSIALAKGAELSMPVNVDGYKSTTLFATYAFPVSLFESTMTLNSDCSYNQTPSLTNDTLNRVHATSAGAGWSLASNVSVNTDFTFGYTCTYNDSRGSLASAVHSQYFEHQVTARLNLIFWDGFVMRHEVNQQCYSGSSTYRQHSLLWNASIGKKFFKNKNFELSIRGYDLLQQNKNYARTVTSTYVQDTHSNIIGRYYLLTATYTIRPFSW
jgi:hypothetical protein